jgi:hypothetical protein
LNIQKPHKKAIMERCYEWVSDTYGFNTFRVIAGAPAEDIPKARRFAESYRSWMNAGDVYTNRKMEDTCSHNFFQTHMCMEQHAES